MLCAVVVTYVVRHGNSDANLLGARATCITPLPLSGVALLSGPRSSHASLDISPIQSEICLVRMAAVITPLHLPPSRRSRLPRRRRAREPAFTCSLSDAMIDSSYRTFAQTA
jgi:hypothetical protein